MGEVLIDRYVADHKRFSDNGASGAPGWLTARRAEAIDRFQTLGFPSARNEAWRFTNVAPLVKQAFAPVGDTQAAVSQDDLASAVFGPVHGNLLVFVDGRYRADLSALDRLPKGVVLASLASAIAEGSGPIEEHLTRHTGVSENPFTELSTAFLSDGAFVYVPGSVQLETPLLVVHVTTPAADKCVSHPRNLFVVGSGGSASVVEQYLSIGQPSSWTNAVTEVVVEEDARLDTYRIQYESDRAYHTATTQSYQQRNSNYALNTVVLGSALCRHDINAVLDGQGAECTLHGLTQVRGSQHVDHHTTIDHAQPHCNSWEFFNGIYDERARGVFTGRIIVRPGAQRTDSKQTSNSLLLSERARADSQPQLEIYADDVKCTHGATLGPIDERSMFYLRSRGLTAEEARNVLTYGFGVEILSKIKQEDVRARLDTLIKARLEEGTTWRRAEA